MNEKYERVMELYNNGLSYNQIAKALNMNKSTVAYYAKRFDNEKYLQDKELKEKQRLEYEKIVCEVFLKQKSLHKTCKMLNKKPSNTNYKYITQILNKYNIKIDKVSYYLNLPKKRKLEYDDIFKEDSSLSSTSHLSEYIFKFELKEKCCELCGITSWNGKDIGFHVHHINGVRTDNRIENLQILCPNCHSQTDNFCGRKKKKEKRTEKFVQEKKSNTKMPNKEMLLETFKEKGSFKQVGVFYGVSDNAVKKWFKKYDLPSSSPEVRKMIIEKYGEQPQWYSYMENRDYSRSIEKRGHKIEIYDDEGKYLTTCVSINEAGRYTKMSPTTLKKYFDGYKIKNTKFIMKKV